ncbi:MAG: outer membrane beta-barrel protein [Bacteroidota bacterium]
MKYTCLLTALCLVVYTVSAQIDPDLLRTVSKDSGTLKLNMDAVYERPFIKMGKLPVSLGGYVEANYQYVGQDGITEGHQFQFRRLTLFVSSTITNRLKFLTEIEFEDGAKEINIEFASVDFEIAPLLNFRAGIIMNPIGAFNQNHDGPKWEFVDRPISATQMLPATFSNVGFGVYGKKYSSNWVYAYEAYLTNGFDERIIDNSENKTFLPATKENADRFEESFNGAMLFTGKIALRNRKVGELGLSYMGGVYNKFSDDGFVLDKKRRVDVYAIDFNTSLRRLNTIINAEYSFVHVDIPATYTEQFGRKQNGGFIDLVQPVFKKPIFGFDKSVFNVAVRLEYVDWNKGNFKSTGSNIADDVFSITPAISWRPAPQTVFRFNYRYTMQQDLLGNPPSRQAAIQFGLSTYF